VSRTGIEINGELVHEAQKLTGLKTKRAIVDRALDLLVRTEKRKGLLRYYGRGVFVFGIDPRFVIERKGRGHKSSDRGPLPVRSSAIPAKAKCL
jgi:hypothetical protein